MNSSFSKYIYFSLIALAIIAPLSWASVTSIQVGNPAPVFMDLKGKPTEPSDGGKEGDKPAASGETIVFSATAIDINGDDYYLAICKTDKITPNNEAGPTCEDGGFGVSPLTKSGELAKINYQVDDRAGYENEWFAFVCDHVVEGAGCSKPKKGQGSTGSPFLAHKKVGVIRFGDDCPELSEIKELKKDKNREISNAHAFKLLKEDLSSREVRRLIREEVDSIENNEIREELKIVADKILELKKEVQEKGDLSRTEENEVVDEFFKKQEKLRNLAAKNVNFCVTTSSDDRIENMVDKKDEVVEKKNEHEIDKEGLKLTFEPGQERSITMEFRQKEATKAAVEKASTAKGPKIEAKKSENADDLITSTQLEAEKSEKAKAEPEVIRTISLKHQSLEPEKQTGLFNFFFSEPQKESSIVTNPSFDLNVVNADASSEVSENEIVYQSADNRKTDLYRYINDPTGAFSHTIKNYTLYHYGEGDEAELYTFENAVLHRREDGVIEGYSIQLPDLSGQPGADQASPGLLGRAARVLAQDQINTLHHEGGRHPDFIVPAPFALNNENEIIEGLTYQIVGDQFNQLKVKFKTDIESYPLVLDPSIQFTAPGASNVGDSITGEAVSSFGFSVGVGDLNNDGKDDLAVGSIGTGGGNGAIYIFYQTDAFNSSYAGADLVITGELTSALATDLRIVDMDGDGDNDLVASANAYSDGGAGGHGRVYIFYNDGSYPTTAAGADVKITGDEGTFFGEYLVIGDLDGDRLNDLVASAKSYSNNRGRVYAFYSAGGYSATVTGADVTLTGEVDGDGFGHRIVVEDFNQDGDRDIAVSSQGYSASQGRVHIFYNDGAYPATSDLADVNIDGSASSTFGYSLTTGDMDNDGYPDLIAGSHTYNGQQGRVHIFYNDGAYPVTSATADVNIDGETDSGMGSKILAGDFNGDGVDDLAAGGIIYNNNFTGRLYVFYGGGTFPASSANADSIITGENTFNGFSEDMAMGDLNGDGNLDLVIAANQYNGGQGRVYLLYGEGGAVEQKEVLTGENNNDLFAHAFAVADFDSDGTTDLAVGAPGYSAGDGVVYLFFNKGKSLSNGVADFTILGSDLGGNFGAALTAGDIDADGDDDLLVSAPIADKVYHFNNLNNGSYPANSGAADGSFSGTGDTEFGTSLAVGDIDADGDDDVVIGAPLDTDGVVQIYYNDGVAYGAADDTIAGEVVGGNFGFSLVIEDLNSDGENDIGVGAPASANGDFYIFYYSGAAYPDAGAADVNLTGIGAGDFFGASVVAKDLNADNKPDLLIGASGNIGSALIYFNDGSYTVADDVIAGPAAASEFGAYLSVDDLNSDGYQDVAIGAPGTANGSAYIFYGPNPYSDASAADLTITGDTAGDQFGSNVAIADFDADGINDVVIGATAYSTSKGRVYPFFGKRDYNWVTQYPWRNDVGGSSGRYGNTNQIEGWAGDEAFAHAIATGDFDGNGTTDLAVGAPDYKTLQGRVYLFLNQGNMPLNSNSADVIIEGLASSQFGSALAAGDLSTTPDTKDDLLIGAPGVATGDGAVYLFNGRSAANWAAVSNYANRDNEFSGVLASGSLFGSTLLVVDDFGPTPDGQPDFVVGAPGANAGNAYVYYGDSSYGSSDLTFSGEAPGDEFGSSLAAGDLNTTPDGLTDLLIGAPRYETDTGRAYIFYNDGNTVADVTYTGGAQGDEFGAAVAVGELSAARDGLQDVIIGAPGTANGTAYIFYNDGNTVADVTLTGEAAGNRFGQGLISKDLNRDDQDDLVVVSGAYSNNSGRVQVYYNSSGIEASSNDVMTGEIGSNIYFGSALLIDDLTGNGWNNLLVGAYGTYNGSGSLYMYDYGAHYLSDEVGDQYGRGLAVGDFDGDGDKDLAIGNPAENSSQGEVFIFLQDLSSMEKGVTPAADVVITGPASSEFGFALAAGEVSEATDTKDDLLIGAPGLTTGDGAIYLFNGRANWSGVTSSDNADVTIAGTLGAAGRFGEAIVVGTDLVGTSDGLDDFAGGAPDDGNGSVYFYDNDGVYPTTAETANHTLVGPVAGRYGAYITTGYFNSDALLDLAIGTPLASGNDGRVDITYNDGDYANSDVAIAGETGSRFGTGISSGDLDRDGDDDLIVGAPTWTTNQGRVYVAYQDGAYPALAANAELTIDGSAGIYFGQSVKGADFNGDSYVDLMASAESVNYVYFNDGTYPSSCCSDYDLQYVDSQSSYNFNSIPRRIAVGDLTNDGQSDILIASPGFSTGTGALNFYAGARIQCEPLSLSSLTITDSSGYTNSLTPDLTIAYTGNGPAPIDAVFSCDQGESWSASQPVIGAVSPVLVDTFDITSGATGCTANEDLKTILVRLRSTCGYLAGSFSSDSTTYDISGPTITTFNAAPDSSSQITVTVTALNDGTGSADPYQYQFSGEGCTGGLAEQAWTLDADNNDIFSGLTANTPYAFKVRARDELENVGAYSACSADVYTAADTPGASIVSGATLTTLDVNPVTGGAEKDMAIYVEQGLSCDGVGGLGFVQGDGTIAAGVVYDSDVNWGNKTVTGLTQGTQYSFCVKARNMDDVETAYGASTTASTLSPPSFNPTYPSDNLSDTATPTGVGNEVTFSADVTDAEGDAFWLLVCKNNLAPVVGSPPECNGGASNRWAISALTGNGVTAFATYSPQLGDPELNTWYAFACDTSGCSAADQGSGASGSPFAVNHPPTFGPVDITDNIGGSIEPGEVIKFELALGNFNDTDTDGAQDTIDMYVCDAGTVGFDFEGNTCVGGSLICSALGVNPTAGAAACDDSANSQAPIPTSHGLKSVQVFVEDVHGLASSSNTNHSYSVSDVPPTLVDYNVVDVLDPVAGGSDSFTFNARLQDDNGEDDIVSVEGYLFNADTTAIGDGVCVTDETSCYQVPTCTLNLPYGDGSQIEAQCTTTVWFNAAAGANWEVHVNPADELGVVTNLADSNININNPVLMGIGITGGLAYGSVNIGQVSEEQTVTVQNLGNSPLDVNISGTDLSDEGGNIIPRAQQEWFSAADFVYNDGYDLVEIPDTVGPATGCYDASAPVRSVHNVGVGSDTATYWKYKVPTGISPGAYSGVNTFSAATCDGGGGGGGGGGGDVVTHTYTQIADLEPFWGVGACDGLDGLPNYGVNVEMVIQPNDTTATASANGAEICTGELFDNPGFSRILNCDNGGLLTEIHIEEPAPAYSTARIYYFDVPNGNTLLCGNRYGKDGVEL